MPRISVIMPVYNGAKYVQDAVKSILSQSYQDFEFIIVNDCSSDSTLEQICLSSDSRIRILNNERNIGVAASLNRGIREARGEFIARMDADDIARPDRFTLQVQAFNFNSRLDIVGGAINVFGFERSRIVVYPLADEQIKAALLFDSAFAHPTVMFRKVSFLERGLLYNEVFRRAAEDYELWTRAAAGGLIMANLNNCLLDYRMHQSNVSKLQFHHNIENVSKIRKQYLDSIGVKLSEDSWSVHTKISNWDFSWISAGKVELVRSWMQELERNLEDTRAAWLEGFRSEVVRRFTIGYYSNFLSREMKRGIRSLKLLENTNLSFRQKKDLVLPVLRDYIISKFRTKIQS